MNEIVERVRLAIIAEIENQGRLLDDDLSEPVARAAIAALREPTAKMSDIPHIDVYGQSWLESHQAVEVWKAMVDAALKQ